MTLLDYEQVPPHEAQKVIDEYRKQQAEAAKH
jgi:hypothetical protein